MAASRLAAARALGLSGFSEAELAARDWARKLPEVQENYRRPTNAQLRSGGTAGRACRTPAEVILLQDDKEAKDVKEKKAKKEKKDRRKDGREAEDGSAEKVKKHKKAKKERKAPKEKKSKDKACERKTPKVFVLRHPDSAPRAEPSQAPDASAKDVLVSAVKAILEDQPAPSDPNNPLLQAQNLKAYEELKQYLRLRAAAEREGQETDQQPPWNHEGFVNRPESPCRERTDGTHWPTRRGAWRSRAGGAYLPPEREPAERSPSRSPAKYLYPEEFRKRLFIEEQRRRSPSYRPEKRPRSSSSSRSPRPASRSRRKRARASRRQRPAAGAAARPEELCGEAAGGRGGGAEEEEEEEAAQREPPQAPLAPPPPLPRSPSPPPAPERESPVYELDHTQEGERAR